MSLVHHCATQLDIKTENCVYEILLFEYVLVVKGLDERFDLRVAEITKELPNSHEGQNHVRQTQRPHHSSDISKHSCQQKLLLKEKPTLLLRFGLFASCIILFIIKWLFSM